MGVVRGGCLECGQRTEAGAKESRERERARWGGHRVGWKKGRIRERERERCTDSPDSKAESREYSRHAGTRRTYTRAHPPRECEKVRQSPQEPNRCVLRTRPGTDLVYRDCFGRLRGWLRLCVCLSSGDVAFFISIFQSPPCFACANFIRTCFPFMEGF